MASSDSISYANLNEGLRTLDPVTGSVPNTRMAVPTQVRDMVTRAIRYDQNYRDWKRARLKGLVDGNPPHQQSALIAAGRGDECNVNWRQAKFFLTTAQNMLYDILTEGETLSTVELDEHKIMAKLRREGSEAGDLASASPDQIAEWSRIATAKFEIAQRGDPDFDWNMQISQGQCCLYGCGPMVFEDELDWRPWAFESRVLLVPEWAKSNPNKWEWCALICEYTPDRLYEHIVNPEAAQKRGWNVASTRRSIMGAHPLTRTGVMYQNWSWHQDLLKNGTYYYADQSKMIRTAHFYFREFPEDDEEEGSITEHIIDLDGEAASASGEYQFLCTRSKKYANWREAIHPIYWAPDVNGYHHSVTGLGVEMYAALDYMNRLFCRTADDAFAPKLFFKPVTASEREKLSIAQVGRYGLLPANLEAVQQHVQPFLQEGIAMTREVMGVVQQNLSQFRSQALMRESGNPPTAQQVNYMASEQAKMGASQLSRVYEQYDWLYGEKYRRITNPSLTRSVRGGDSARDFVDACTREGVPEWALRMTKSVKATRVTGQGSQYLRQQALEFLMGMAVMLPESGRQNLVRDIIASRAGQSKVDRYAPRAPNQNQHMEQQQADAMLQVSAMKTGVPPVLVDTQNPAIYAAVFTQASEAAAQSIAQGTDPHEPLAFTDIAVPAAEQHVQRMAGDRSRKQMVDALQERLGQVKQFTDEVKVKLQQQDQERAQAQQQMGVIAAGMDPETQVGLAKVAAKERVDMTKLQGQLTLKERKMNADLGLAAHRQGADLSLQAHRLQTENALADAETAAGIQRDAAVAKAKVASSSRNGGEGVKR